MHEVHSSGHFDWRVDVRWHGYFDKAINSLIEHCEM